MLRLRAHALAVVNVLLAALLLAGLGTPASAAFPPRPDGPVYDGANIISPATEAALNRQLRDYNAQTGRAIVVATVPNLDGQPVEKYATELFGTWGIGGAKRDQGLLLLVARDDRKMRIEVGYGLHPYFGGIMAGRVIRDVITPRFKEGDFDGGITSGVDAILTHLARSPADAAAIEEAAQAAEQNRRENAGPVIGGAIFWIVLIIFFISIFARRRRGFRRGSGFGSAVGNIILWEALNAATRGASRDWGDGGGGFGGFGGGGGSGFGGFGGGMSGGGGASGSW